MLNLQSPPDRERVVVTDIRIPFWSMVRLLFTMAIASIPATILIFGLLVGLIIASTLFLGSVRSLVGTMAAQATPSPTAMPIATPATRLSHRIDAPTPTPSPDSE